MGVAPFSQPQNTAALLLGRLPEHQGKIPADALPKLDAAFAKVLAADCKRPLRMLPPLHTPDFTKFHAAESPRALTEWVAYGKSNAVEMLIVPQVLDWRQRDGSPAGVTESAAVRLEFFLIDVRTGGIVNRSVLEEKQLGLLDDLGHAGKFFKRHGAWITAEELAEEGMHKAVKDLGL